MRIALKILLFPFVIAIDLVAWICAGVLSCSAFVFSLASAALSVLAFAVLLLLTCSVTNGLILFGFAVIVSPMGLPLLAAWMLSGLQNLSLAIKGI